MKEKATTTTTNSFKKKLSYLENFPYFFLHTPSETLSLSLSFYLLIFFLFFFLSIHNSFIQFTYVYMFICMCVCIVSIKILLSIYLPIISFSLYISLSLALFSLIFFCFAFHFTKWKIFFHSLFKGKSQKDFSWQQTNTKIFLLPPTKTHTKNNHIFNTKSLSLPCSQSLSN